MKLRVSINRACIFVLSLCSLASTASVQAESCKDVLSGMYNTDTSTSSEDRMKSFRNYVCSKVSSRDFGLDLPDKLNVQLSELHATCNPNESFESFSKRANAVVAEVNKFVVDAWSGCMSTPGLKVGLVYGADPQNFLLKFKYNPVSTRAMTTELAHKGVGNVDNGLQFRSSAEINCSPDWINVGVDTRREIAISQQLSCSRKYPSATVDITINTLYQEPVFPSTISIPAMK